MLPTGYHPQDITYPQDINVMDTPNGYKMLPTGYNLYPVGPLHHQNSCVPTAYVPHGIYMLYPRHIPTVYQGCICRGYMMWRTNYAVGHMPWGTMSMLPTPYAYAVWNTYSVDDVLYDVGGYSVGDMP